MTLAVHALKEPLYWQTSVVVSQVSAAPLVSTSGRVLSAAGSRSNLSPVQAMGVVWSVVSGIPFKHAKNTAAKGVTKDCWSRWVRSIGEVLCEENEKCHRANTTAWKESQWDEVAFGTRKYQRGRRQRQSGVQWAVTGVRVHPETKQLMEVDCHFVRNRSAAEMAPHILSDVSSVDRPVVTTDRWAAYPTILSVVKGAEHMTVNHSETFKDPVTGAHTNHVEGAHSLMKREFNFPASPV